MSDELVKRLREMPEFMGDHARHLGGLAADRIEALEAELAQVKTREEDNRSALIQNIDDWSKRAVDAEAENARRGACLEHLKRHFSQRSLYRTTGDAAALTWVAVIEEALTASSGEPSAAGEAEQGSQMNWKAALSLYRRGNDWLDGNLRRGAKCSCGSCHLCAYTFLEQAAQHQESDGD